MNGFPYARTMYARLISYITNFHSIIHTHVKFRRNRGNINIAIDIESRLSHIHWPIFSGEYEDGDEIGDVNFHKKSCCDEKVAPKRG